MGSPKNIGVFGGTFNPPHYGHALAALYALLRYELDEVWFVPAYGHAFKTVSVSFEHRREMLRCMVAGMGKRFRVSSIEKSIRNSGKALLTLEALRSRHPGIRFRWILGSDLIPEIPRWYRSKELEKRFGFLIVPRGRSRDTPFGIPNIQSTRLRRNLRLAGTQAMTSPAVLRYARKHRLYG